MQKQTLGYFAKFKEESSFIREYLWKYRRYVGIGLLALVLVDILEVLPPFILKEAVDAAMNKEPIHQIIWFAVAYFVTGIFQALGRYGWRMYLIRASHYAGQDLREKFTEHLFTLSASFFDKRPIGDLMARATSDVESVRQAVGTGLLVFADALFYFLTVPVAMFWLSPELTLLVFIPLPIIPWIVIRNEKAIHQRFQKVQDSLSGISSLVQEGLSGIRVIKAFAKEETQLKRLRNKGEDFVRLSLRLARVQTAFGPTLDFAVSTGMVILLYFGGMKLISAGAGSGTEAALTLGTFVAFQRYIQKMVWPMAAIGMAISFYQRAVSSSDRLKEIIHTKPDVSDSEMVLAHSPAPKGRDYRTPGKVEFRNLSFKFPGAERAVLTDINLTIEPGERIAFIGAIGAGKSALLSLLPRVYPVARGMLFIDDIDINDWPIQELRKQVGYVSQEVFLFSETITENVAFGLHEWFVPGQFNENIHEATKLAAVHEDVGGLPSGFMTQLGERGVNLSGGQKQRITIARALAKQPPILVLDDALSSVDVQTEEKILKGLRDRPRRNTELIAAHRISTIRDADRIVVLGNGCIRQMGSHEYLLSDRRGAYRRFFEQQILKEELESYTAALDSGEK